MKNRSPWSRRALLGTLLAVAGLLALAAGAQAAVPSWQLLAATGPTHLPPRQSETQRVTVEAEGGEFALGYSAEGEGTLSQSSGVVRYTENSNTAIALYATRPFEAGQVIYFETGATPKVPYGTVIESVAGKVLTLSAAANATGNSSTRAGNPQVTGVANADEFATFVGEEISGEGVPAGTTLEAAGGNALTLSEPPTKGGTVTLKTGKQTAPIPFDASPAALQGTLETTFGAGNFSVTGGPGGDTSHPYFVTFAGAFANADQQQLTPDSGALVGEHAHVGVFTTVPGGPGTGFIGVYPSNVGGAATSGEITAEVGPLPAGLTIPGPFTVAGWSCTGATAGATAICTTNALVAALEPALPIRVPVEVDPTSPGNSAVSISVSGGGAARKAIQAPVVISAQPAPEGIAGFWFGAFDENGRPETAAGAHPYSVESEILFNTVRTPSGVVNPAGHVKEIWADLPPGLVGNPLVTDRCPQSLITRRWQEVEACGEDNRIGGLFPQTGFARSSNWFGIYNDVPVGGTAAEFSSSLVAPVATLLGSIRSEEDFGIRVTAPNIATYQPVFGVLTSFEGRPAAAHGQAFFTNPSDCAEQRRQAPVARLNAATWQHPSAFKAATVQLPPVTGCDKLHFQPQFAFQPTSTQGSSGVGATAHLHIDQGGLTDPNRLATPPLKKSVVKLPEGFNVNPSQANGLEACSEAQVGYVGSGPLPNPTRFNNNPVSCPDGSKLGTVEATTPLLEEPLKGTIYLAAQEENPFDSLIGLYLVFESPRFGITLKLPGKVDNDPRTGQVTATFAYVPQQPVEDLTLHFRGGGPRSEFAAPEVCGTYSTHGSWEPWSAPESGPPAQTSDSFTVSDDCSASAGSRPFHPAFEAGTTGTQAGSYSPMVIKINRDDGEQELTKLDFTLPLGLTAKLAGIPYCSDAAIATAAGRAGRAELASPSCPAASRIGTVDTSAGVGSEPIHVGGKVYLAGPYKGAPLSAVVVTPAVAGPFDLGTVVVRTPLHVNQRTAQITASSDPIPTILKGIPLKLRSVSIHIDRSNFSLNPTDCEAMAVDATLHGSSGGTARPSNRFQVGGCKKLRFKPKLSLTLKGATKRTGHPALKAVVTYPVYSGTGCATPAKRAHRLSRKAGQERRRAKRLSGGRAARRLRRQARRHAHQARKLRGKAKQCLRDGPPAEANIARAQVGLPHAEFLDQGNLDKVCKQGDLRAGTCPKKSIYGHAKAWSPLLAKPLQGPVYLGVGFGYKLPALVADLNGQIRILLVGRVDTTKHHGIRNTFEVVPDAPVSRFVLKMKGGKKYGLLENSENICKKKQRASAMFNAQNGLRLHLQPKIGNSCKRHKKKQRNQTQHKKRG